MGKRNPRKLVEDLGTAPKQWQPPVLHPLYQRPSELEELAAVGQVRYYHTAPKKEKEPRGHEWVTRRVVTAAGGLPAFLELLPMDEAGESERKARLIELNEENKALRSATKAMYKRSREGGEREDWRLISERDSVAEELDVEMQSLFRDYGLGPKALREIVSESQFTPSAASSGKLTQVSLSQEGVARLKAMGQQGLQQWGERKMERILDDYRASQQMYLRSLEYGGDQTKIARFKQRLADPKKFWKLAKSRGWHLHEDDYSAMKKADRLGKLYDKLLPIASGDRRNTRLGSYSERNLPLVKSELAEIVGPGGVSTKQPRLTKPESKMRKEILKAMVADRAARFAGGAVGKRLQSRYKGMEHPGYLPQERRKGISGRLPKAVGKRARARLAEPLLAEPVVEPFTGQELTEADVLRLLDHPSPAIMPIVETALLRLVQAKESTRGGRDEDFPVYYGGQLQELRVGKKDRRAIKGLAGEGYVHDAAKGHQLMVKIHKASKFRDLSYRRFLSAFAQGMLRRYRKQTMEILRVEFANRGYYVRANPKKRKWRVERQPLSDLEILASDLSPEEARMAERADRIREQLVAAGVPQWKIEQVLRDHVPHKYVETSHVWDPEIRRAHRFERPSSKERYERQRKKARRFHKFLETKWYGPPSKWETWEKERAEGERRAWREEGIKPRGGFDVDLRASAARRKFREFAERAGGMPKGLRDKVVAFETKWGQARSPGGQFAKKTHPSMHQAPRQYLDESAALFREIATAAQQGRVGRGFPIEQFHDWENRLVWADRSVKTNPGWGW